MNDTMMAMRSHALRDEAFRLRLLATQSDPEPLEALCRLASEYGYFLTPGEILSDGEEFSCNQTKSTNGGNPMPYDCFDDSYEMFMISISK